MSFYLVTGHYCPTDANPESDAEDFISTSVVDTLDEAKHAALWFADAEITKVDERPSDDSGGSSYLCECAGVDTGRHAEWCHYLQLFLPVS